MVWLAVLPGADALGLFFVGLAFFEIGFILPAFGADCVAAEVGFARLEAALAAVLLFVVDFVAVLTFLPPVVLLTRVDAIAYSCQHFWAADDTIMK